MRALADAIRNTRGLLKPKEDPPTLDDILEGMTAVMHVRIPEPQFTSQTKDELSTAGITRVVQALVEQHLKAWMEDRRTKAEARTVLQKIVDAARVRLTQKQQKDAARRKTALEGASMPAEAGRLPRRPGWSAASCSSWRGTARSGTARMARSSEYQALLPIRGKILNVQKANLQQVLDNAECSAIVQVLGAGSGRTFDLDAMRYGRVLIMADADVDGSHIRTLLITLFAKYMRPVIEAGPALRRGAAAAQGGHQGPQPADHLHVHPGGDGDDGGPAGEGGQAGRHADPAVQGPRRDGRRRAVGHHDEPGHPGRPADHPRRRRGGRGSSTCSWARGSSPAATG